MRHYKSLGFKYTGFIDNFLNDNPQYEAIAITYNSDDKLYHLLYKDSAQQPVDAVAFAEWIQDNKYEWRHDSTRHDYRKWRAAWNNHSIHTTAELLTLFSSQTKQP